jgi:RNA polymerase sigma-70 factor (ECF subfamily)
METMTRPERTALEALVRATRPGLRRLAARYLGRSDAEDAVQEACVRLLCAGSPVRHGRRFLKVATTTAALDHLRRARHRSPACLGLVGLDLSQAGEAGPEQAAVAAQEARDLATALDELPGRCRDALLLSRIEGISHLAIAARLGVSPKTVERDIARALRHCVERVDRREGA